MFRRTKVYAPGTPTGLVSPPLTLTMGTDAGNLPGFTIQFAVGAPSGQPGFQIVDLDGTILANIFPTGAEWYAAKAGVITSGLSQTIYFDCTSSPPSLVIGGWRLWVGTGAPATSAFVGTPSVGDWYLRSDTPATANQRVYVYTAGGWVAIA